jgi:hypothetical protein
VTYRYVDLGAVVGLPDMFEPSWYTAKLLSLLAEAAAALASVILLLAGRSGHGKHKIGIVRT